MTVIVTPPAQQDEWTEYPKSKPFPWQHVNICYAPERYVAMAIFEDGKGFHLIQVYNPHDEGIIITGELLWQPLPKAPAK